ncbi:hypothetical protein E2C01_007795 [Portunus trituberculatus]|uniref:Uncharacterized protein n=1 Tax=Portunus trituberculatus TaxID=210409 RepID=A0A5B7CZ40_PORTR|nr:hypothetical protein [Portunus trituberculatus]
MVCEGREKPKLLVNNEISRNRKRKIRICFTLEDHIHTDGSLSQNGHGYCNLAGTGGLHHPCCCNPHHANHADKHTSLIRTTHGQSTLAAVTVNTVAMTVAVWNFTFIMTDAALTALPAWPTHTLPIANQCNQRGIGMTPRYSHHCLNSPGDSPLCTQRTQHHSSSLLVDPHRHCTGLRTSDLVRGVVVVVEVVVVGLGSEAQPWTGVWESESWSLEVAKDSSGRLWDGRDWEKDGILLSLSQEQGHWQCPFSPCPDTSWPVGEKQNCQENTHEVYFSLDSHYGCHSVVGQQTYDEISACGEARWCGVKNLAPCSGGRSSEGSTGRGVGGTGGDLVDVTIGVGEDVVVAAEWYNFNFYQFILSLIKGSDLRLLNTNMELFFGEGHSPKSWRVLCGLHTSTSWSQHGQTAMWRTHGHHISSISMGSLDFSKAVIILILLIKYNFSRIFFILLILKFVNFFIWWTTINRIFIKIVVKAGQHQNHPD